MVNRSKAGAQEIGEQLRLIGEGLGIEMRLTVEHPLPEGFLEGCDTVCVIGGDGTFLGVVPQAMKFGTRILGVNLGKLGFLVTFSPASIAREFTLIAEGNYNLESRTLLSATEPSGDTLVGLNDIVVKQMGSSRLMLLEVFANGELVNDFACDGLIFSTPTGSTAYNLSAGGPIVHPDVEGITLTPICPHTLSNRSVLLSAGTQLEVKADWEASNAQVTIDGRPSFSRQAVFPLTIRVPKERVSLIHGPGYSHFRTVRTKLGWRENSL